MPHQVMLGAVEVGIEVSIGHELLDEQELTMVVAPLKLFMPNGSLDSDLYSTMNHF